MRRRTTFIKRKDTGDPSLLIHFKFDGNTVDEKGNTVTLVNPSDATYTTGVNGQAIVLGNSATNSLRSYVNIDSTPALQSISSGFTLAMWVKTGIGASNQQLFSNFIENKPGIYLQVHSSLRIMFNIRNEAGTITTLYSSNVASGANVSPDIWHHYTWTYDGDTLRCYYDFALSNSLVVGTLNINTLDAWSINRRNTQTATASYDDFRLYNRALDSTEIGNL